MKKRINGFLVLLLALITQITFAQDMNISGVVSDSNGLPIPGANVKVKGTSTGTSTDFDGSYKIKARSTDVLVFTFQGMNTQELKVSGTKMNARLASKATELEGLVVTALGVKKSEKAIGYSAQSLKGATLTEAREANLVNALSGKIAGAQVTGSSGAVGSSARIVLRGNSTITGNNEALFVVDGIPFDNSNGTNRLTGVAAVNNPSNGGGRDLPNGIASINPDDIESITVLKGPNAAALYGIRAAQGVILITTKKGKNNKSLGVSFNTNVAFSNPLVTPDFQNSYGQSGDPANNNFFEFTDGASTTSVDGTDESWGLPLDRGFSFIQWDSYKYGGAPRPWVSQPNNVKNFYDTGVTVSNNISFSGGGEKADFRFSVGNSDEAGIVPFTNFEKFNISGNGNLKLGESVTAGVNFNYFNDKSNNLPVTGYDGDNPLQQTIFSARNINFEELRDWRNLPLTAKGTPLNWNNNFQNNPYWALENNTNDYLRDRITGKFTLGYKMTNKFTITGNVAIDTHNTTSTSRQAFGSLNNRVGAGEAPFGNFDITTSKYKEVNADLLLNYNTKLSEDVNLTLNAGANSMRRVTSFVYGRAAQLELPNLYNLSNLRTGAILVATNRSEEQRIHSVYGFGQVAYKTYFFLDFTARNDWSSLLSAKNNSFFYPSVNTSIVLSDIFKTKSINIDLLKVRAGWAKVGSTGALQAYNLNDIFNLTPGGYGNIGTLPAIEYDPNISPESNTGKEIGLDVNAFSNRLRFAATYYIQESKDLILPVDVSRASGFAQSVQNAASLENKGIELQLGVTALKTPNFSFDIDLNFAQNKNTVLSLGDSDAVVLGQGVFGVSVEARVGQPYGVLFGTDFVRDANNNVVHKNGLPELDPVKKILGNVAPDWTGGANFSFKYKNFEFTTLIDAKIGGDIHSLTNTFGRFAGVLEETLIGREGGLIAAGVMSDGAGGYVPNNVVVSAEDYNKVAFGSNAHSSSIFDASYVKLRQMTFGFSMPRKLLKGLSIEDVKFSVVARNLAILLRNTPHIDPETAFSSGNNALGLEFGQVSAARSIGFNINVKF